MQSVAIEEEKEIPRKKGSEKKGGGAGYVIEYAAN